MTSNITERLVFGPSDGDFKKIFEKTETLNKKHHFDFLLCIGDFLSEFHTNDSEITSLIEGRINGKSGTLITSKGIKITCLGGMNSTENKKYKEEMFSCETLQDNSETEQCIYESEVNYIIEKGRNTDIFITFEWPKDICKFSYKNLPELISGAQPIATVASHIQPRYHFSSNGSIFYEREPYKNILSEDKQKTNITRFISLASLNNSRKERAFNITTLSSYNVDTSDIPNATQCPFVEEIGTNFKDIKHSLKDPEYNIFPNKKSSFNKREKHNTETNSESYQYANKEKNRKTNYNKVPENYICKICNKTGHLIYDCPESNIRKSEKENNTPSNYICKICSQKGHWIQNCPYKDSYFRKNTNYPKSDFCFFCLSDPRISRSETYLALPKGPLTTSSTNPPTLPFSGHVLIIPIAHIPTINAIEEVSREKIKEEMERQVIKHTVFSLTITDIEFLLTKSFEISIHLHWQVIPIKKDIANTLEDAFISAGIKMHYTFEKRDIQDEENYLRIWLPDGSILIHTIDPHEYFDLQFPRHIISQVLGLEKRKDWKSCVQTNEEECQDAAQFKKHFKDFDFTI
ncbi:hypothetical protein PORY_002386 [Pneumocystis oryctolagi]|uniref:Uncharacterized protein n=1 Tax=Pneumocystis oryctolagi TaxID=42067 RepID=A0ACB7C9S5_9ASCO|nr:hypothetical protein PORY_002386 [Pneumocystis oryctolagi]